MQCLNIVGRQFALLALHTMQTNNVYRILSLTFGGKCKISPKSLAFWMYGGGGYGL